MKCEWVQENILLYIYNELQDDARYELEQHIARCAGCAAELKASRQFHTTISRLPVEEPSPNLLASSRMRLQESLETTEQGGFWQRLFFDPGAWLRPIKFAPALAAAIFIVGFGGGIAATYQVMVERGTIRVSGGQFVRSGVIKTKLESVIQPMALDGQLHIKRPGRADVNLAISQIRALNGWLTILAN